MDYYGLLFLYYLKGLSGKSVLKLFFNIEAGGTEQLLPENTSAPTTTPILADIQYPDGLRTDQYFTYRETPTTVSNKARIKTIKGNTLVWNQLVQNGNFANTDNWVGNGTITVSNNTMTYVKPSGWNGLNNSVSFSIVADHKYLVTYSAYVETNTAYLFWADGIGLSTNLQTIYVGTTWQNYSIVLTATRNITGRIPWFDGGNAFTLHLKNYMVIDLTMLNDSRITDLDSFKSYYPLDYYDYNAGTLLSFNGTGLKAVGKNQFDTSSVTTTTVDTSLNITENSIEIVHTGGVRYAQFIYGLTPAFTDIFIKGNYRLSFDVVGITEQWAVGLRNRATNSFASSQIIVIETNGHYSFTINTEQYPNHYLSFCRTGDSTRAFDVTFSNIQLELGTTETSYTPFEEQTISLPISQYFPTGMKSAGTVYDELTPRKAITRVGAVDMGSMTWRYIGGVNARFESSSLSDVIKKLPNDNTIANILCSAYSKVATLNNVYFHSYDPCIAESQGGNIGVYDSRFTDLNSFTSAMQGVYLYYELATPTETPIATEDANEALSLLMGKSVSSNNANQLINIITKGE